MTQGRRELKVFKAIQEQQVIRVHKDCKDFKVLLVQPVTRVRREHRDYKVYRALLEQPETPDRKAHKGMSERQGLQATPVHRVCRDYRAFKE